MLVRFSSSDNAPLRPGLKRGDRVVDLSSRFPTVGAFIAAYPDGWKDEEVAGTDLPSLPVAEVRLGPPVDDGASVYLVGANYKKHAEEAGLDVPATPVIFMKPTTALVG